RVARAAPAARGRAGATARRAGAARRDLAVDGAAAGAAARGAGARVRRPRPPAPRAEQLGAHRRLDRARRPGVVDRRPFASV
ncbi:MAG: hypothetical protein-transmembrane region and signal peptide prediction, partial [uncultured Gemmatimonadaceae bacterium]